MVWTWTVMVMEKMMSLGDIHQISWLFFPIPYESQAQDWEEGELQSVSVEQKKPQDSLSLLAVQ